MEREIRSHDSLGDRDDHEFEFGEFGEFGCGSGGGSGGGRGSGGKAGGGAFTEIESMRDVETAADTRQLESLVEEVIIRIKSKKFGSRAVEFDVN